MKGMIDMSTLEKAMELLQTMPEQKIEAIYTYICFVNSQMDIEETSQKTKSANSIVGIAHKYANSDLIPLEKEAFANAMGEKYALNRR